MLRNPLRVAEQNRNGPSDAVHTLEIREQGGQLQDQQCFNMLKDPNLKNCRDYTKYNIYSDILYYIYMSCGPAVGIHVHGSRITQFGFKLVGADLWVAPIGYGGSL